LSQKNLDAVVFREWRKHKEEVVATIFGYPVLSISCAFSFRTKPTLPDGTNAEEEIMNKLWIILRDHGEEKISYKETLDTEKKWGIIKVFGQSIRISLLLLGVLVTVIALHKFKIINVKYIYNFLRSCTRLFSLSRKQ